MASSASGQTIIDSLPARPPTPPRETSTSIVGVPVKSMLARPLPSESQTSLQTPPNISTPSSAVAETDSYFRSRKKVGWSAHTDYKDPPQYREGHKSHKSSPLSIPPSSLSKPVKGILKPSSSPQILASSLGAELNGTASQATITEMLDSTIKQLAGADRDSRLDAYMMLSRALKASNNLPDRVALQDKMSLFTQFILRDIISKNDKGAIDSSLVNHALSLLATFLHFPAIASMLSSDFSISIVDHSIRGFQDPATPKDVIRHLMQVMAFQNFSAKAMTLDRVGRLVIALHSIEDRVKGKGIVMGRIQIYRRLVKQCRSHMAAHPDWFKDALTDMLSTVKDIRTQAISLGLEAGFALRSDKQFMRKAIEVLQTSSNDGQVYIQFYIQRLEETIKDKTTATYVPQIWSAVTLFLRCPLDRWEYFNPWLKLAQSAFNSADNQTRQEANFAWSRYIYLCLLDGKPSPKALGILCQPLISQLRRKTPSKSTEEVTKLRRVVIGAVCTLLYYGFKPSDNKYSLDLMWDVIVQPIMTHLSNSSDKPDASGDSMMQASRILVGLLDASTPRVWREDRVMDLPLAKPEELPSIDSKWVRKCSAKMFQTVGPILEKRFTDLAKTETITYRLWHALVGSVAAASRKDIKVSEDTTRFFACSFGLLSRVWATETAADELSNKSKLYLGVQNFIKVLFEGLGMLAFTEKKLLMAVPHTYEPAATPSHHPDRSSKAVSSVRSPLTHLFLMLSSDRLDDTEDEDFAEFFLAVFEPFFRGKSSSFCLELAKELIEPLPRNIPSTTGPWILAAKYTEVRLEPEPSTPVIKSSLNDRPLGPEYREIVALLERGFSAKSKCLNQRWIGLFNLLSQRLVENFGEAGRGLLIVEPLARFFVENHVDTSEQLTLATVQASQMVLEIARLPRDQQALETARRRLWGVPATTTRGTLPDLFDNVYKLSTRILETLYTKFKSFESTEVVASYIQTIHLFLGRCLDGDESSALLKLQTGLSLWLQDELAQLQLSGDSALKLALQNLWDRICKYLSTHGPAARSIIDQTEPLLTAAFRSQHPTIVSKAVETWNSLSKDNEEFECSSSLKSVLSSVASKINATPHMESQSSGEFGAQTVPFVGAQADLSFVASSLASSSRISQKKSAQTAPVTRASSRAASKKRRIDSTPDMVPTRRSKRNSTGRLRHEDSQIEFAPIVSSTPVEESQHLTEHQVEVRERQREKATLYAEIQSTSPGQPSERSTRQTARTRASSKVEPQASTPKRTAVYEELISSTPTPRRGQALHLDELNDPPSSPPEPRPYPLLSEIQSRSRASTSLENWEFSSPPTSPVTSRQQVVQAVELPHVTMTDDSTERKDFEMQDAEDPQVIPSSFDVEAALSSSSNVEGVATRSKRAQTKSGSRPTTPPPPQQQQKISQPNAEETPMSVDEEFVDARSSPEPSLPELPPTRAQRKQSQLAKGSTAEGSSGGNFFVELESRPSEMPLHAAGSVSPGRSQSLKRAAECIQVHTDSSTHAKEEMTPMRQSPPPLTPTVLEEVTEVDNKETKRKRKRKGPKGSEDRRKKRRSEERETSQKLEARDINTNEQHTPKKNAEQDLDEGVVGVQTRGSAKKQRQQETKTTYPAQQSLNRRVEADNADTDEELMSQLVTESEAASQSQPPVDTPTTAGSTRKSSRRRRSERRILSRKETAEANIKTSHILNTLRSGLGVLRDAKLSRENVYKIEDVLMDMKRELFQAEQRGRGEESK
ncbi:Telomere length regulator protein rif1 [Paramyrothecium foliicola]|nr:Telomere length regulator protein rif1 [Paramyrothecium foliicola]